MTITRDIGVPAIANGIYFGMAGGGMTGTTDELNAVVNAAAEVLQQTFGQDVVIRFNSDRRSGGAYLRHSTGDWLTSDSQVGINACLVTQEQNDTFLRKFPEWETGGHKLRDPGIYISVGLAAAVLCDDADVSKCREAQGLDKAPKFWSDHGSVMDAIEWVRTSVDPGKLGAPIQDND